MNPDEMSFRDLLEETAGKFPDRIVLYEDRTPYTVKEIDSCAAYAALELSALGVKKGTHVGLYGVNSANWIIVFFAIQKLGALCILLNPRLTREELKKHIESADITFLCLGNSPILKEGESVGDIPFYSFRHDRDFRTLLKEDKAEPAGEALSYRPEPDDPAVMLFTSGSTGRPKCAMLSAYNILIASRESMLNQTLTEDDRTCLILPFFHVFGLVAGIFSNFLAGSVLYLPKDLHTSTLFDVIGREKCTIFHVVPTMMLMLLDSKDYDPEKLSTLRCTILSGAAATKEQICRFHDELPNDHFLSSYGLSEAAPVSSLDYDDTPENCISTVGKPMPHIRLRIVNPETKEECPAGVAGEILVRGDNLMTVYYRVPIEDQSIDEDGWLHTGDLGFLREDGYLCFTGRLKELIIRGGENIYPGEVADAVITLPEVRDVRVVGVPSDFYGEEVCALIIPEAGVRFDEEKAREMLKARIASFKIPSHFLIFDEFPLLATGKADMVTLKKEAERRVKENAG